MSPLDLCQLNSWSGLEEPIEGQEAYEEESKKDVYLPLPGCLFMHSIACHVCSIGGGASYQLAGYKIKVLPLLWIQICLKKLRISIASSFSFLPA